MLAWLCSSITQAEQETDEVYAQITLHPETDVSFTFSFYHLLSPTYLSPSLSLEIIIFV